MSVSFQQHPFPFSYKIWAKSGRKEILFLKSLNMYLLSAFKGLTEIVVVVAVVIIIIIINVVVVVIVIVVVVGAAATAAAAVATAAASSAAMTQKVNQASELNKHSS